MMARWDRWGPLSGLLLCVTWAPMAVAIPRLPDLGSAHDVQAFWRTNQGLMQCVILSVSVGFLFLLVFLGALAELVRTVHGAGAIAWIMLGSALMFMTALNVALGLDIAGGLSLRSTRQVHMCCTQRRSCSRRRQLSLAQRSLSPLPYSPGNQEFFQNGRRGSPSRV